MRRSLVAIFVVVAALIGAGPAHAESLPVVSISPANGATLAPLGAGGGLRFEIKSPITKITNMYVEVATQSSPLGQDGTLASDFQVDFFGLYESDAYPGTYSGTSNHVSGGYWWTSKPGTYYWQARGSYMDYSTSPIQYRTFVSPVYTLTVGTAQPSTPPPTIQQPTAPQGPSTESLYLTTAEAIRTSRSIVREKTGRSAYSLKSRCSRYTDTRLSCRLTWNNGASSARRLWIYTGTMTVRERTDTYTYSFSGYRANAACMDRRGVDRCMRRVRW